MSLIRAIKRDDYEEVLKLLQNGADVNERRGNKDTALIIAAEDGKFEITKLLVENGVDLDAKGNRGWTAAMSATLAEHYEIAQYLFEKGADINAKNGDDITTLMVASKQIMSSKLVKYLLKRGADASRIGRFERTAFKRAKTANQIVNMLLLMARGKLNKNDYKEIEQIKFKVHFNNPSL